MGLEKDYPSTVSTITRTCAKLVSKDEPAGTCSICQRSVVAIRILFVHPADRRRPMQGGLDRWKSQISIRSLTEVTPTEPPQDLLSRSLVPLLCYSCQGTLTSQNSKSISTTERGATVSLPVWTQAKLMDRQRMKGEIQEFLIDEEEEDQ